MSGHPIVPIDKAAYNIGLICKKYFLQVLQEEILSPSYIPRQDSVEEVVNAAVSKCQELGVQVPAENRDLPQIHATITMHKDPVKFRYIIGSGYFVTKQVAKKLVQIVKLISRIHWKYWDKVRFYTGIERNWIVDNQTVFTKENYGIAKKFSNTNLLIDDLATLNNDGYLQQFKKLIYPKVLVLN